MALKKEVVSIYVENTANVLSRVVSLIGRRGFNIDSLTVSATNNPDLSRITMVFEGETLTLTQLIAQIEKLEVVKSVKALDMDKSFFRELLMVKLEADKTQRSAIKEIVDIYRARIINLTKEEMVIELTGSPNKLDAFLEILDCYDIVDICRTGITGIER